MKKLIMVKIAPEIFIKGLNRRSFEKKLNENIVKALEGENYEFVSDYGRTFIETEDLDSVIERLKKVFGIIELCLVSKVESNLDDIYKEALTQFNETSCSTFKVETKRANKDFPMESMEVSRKIGGYILKNTEGVTVDVHNPQARINVEIRKENTYIYSKRIKTAGGMPYNTNGSTMLMLSGGIDSPVAGYLMARRGVRIEAVYYHSHPYTSERAKDKVKELAAILKTYTGKLTLHIVPFTDIQMQIIEKCPENELTIIMRRFMAAVACRLAERCKVDSITTGESVGQVASQTMEGLVVSSDAADRPIFRPLIATDKEDIMDMARKIGTYDTSILPYEDCCTIFVPKHPKTHPRLDVIKASESLLDVEKLISDAVEKTERIEI